MSCAGDQTTWAEQYNAGAEDWLNEYGREMGDAAAAEQVLNRLHLPRSCTAVYYSAPGVGTRIIVTCACDTTHGSHMTDARAAKLRCRCMSHRRGHDNKGMSSPRRILSETTWRALQRCAIVMCGFVYGREVPIRRCQLVSAPVLFRGHLLTSTECHLHPTQHAWQSEYTHTFTQTSTCCWSWCLSRSQAWDPT